MVDREGKQREIYLAGGCFWGLEKLMASIPGVLSAVSGYANGSSAQLASYEAVCSGGTGFREAVKVLYDPSLVSLDALLFAFFQVIDPTVKNRQGNDIGPQYQSGIYYTDEAAKETVTRIASLERERVDPFCMEIGPLQNFYPAEEYHQKYLDKNPGGYCHIPRGEIARLSKAVVDPGQYPRPSGPELSQRLTSEQYRVTQEDGTEPPFENAYWNRFEKGIYVDVATGEPLFSSLHKFESSCGWPAFSAPIEEPTVVSREDRSFGMCRVEVRSRAGNSHLGHVFDRDPESPSGLRYCINSAALRFIPYEAMEEEGYSYLLPIFD